MTKSDCFKKNASFPLIRFKKIFLFVFGLMVSIISYSQGNENLIKTSEYFNDKHKRRDLFLDQNLQVKKEVYFERNSNGVDYQIAAIEYLNGSIRKNIKIYNNLGDEILFIDFENGQYKNYEKEIFLSFKGSYIFDGIQRSGNIVVSYKNGIRNGRLVQTDSAISGVKIEISQVADPRYLNFDIIKFYNQPVTINKYKLFNGIELNFENDHLNGLQKSYYPNSEIKFQAEYKNFRLCSFNSFSVDGSIISRISTNEGFSKTAQIINGTVINDTTNKLYYLRRLSKVGQIIYKRNLPKGQVINRDVDLHLDANENSDYSQVGWKDKNKFDAEKRRFSTEEPMMAVLGIPEFEIVKWDLNVSDDKFIDQIKILGSKGSELSPDNFNYYCYTQGGKYYHLMLPYSNESNCPYLYSEETNYELENAQLQRYLVKAYNLKTRNLKSENLESIIDTRDCLLESNWSDIIESDLKENVTLDKNNRFYKRSLEFSASQELQKGLCALRVEAFRKESSGHNDLMYTQYYNGDWIIEQPGKVKISLKDRYTNSNSSEPKILILKGCDTLIIENKIYKKVKPFISWYQGFPY